MGPINHDNHGDSHRKKNHGHSDRQSGLWAPETGHADLWEKDASKGTDHNYPDILTSPKNHHKHRDDCSPTLNV